MKWILNKKLKIDNFRLGYINPAYKQDIQMNWGPNNPIISSIWLFESRGGDGPFGHIERNCTNLSQAIPIILELPTVIQWDTKLLTEDYKRLKFNSVDRTIIQSFPFLYK